MKVKLFTKDISLIKVDDNAKELDVRLTGKADYRKNVVYFDALDPFIVLLHELYHFYIYRSGVDQLEDFSKEVSCDLSSAFIDALMSENGDDIFIKLKKFAYDYA